MSTKIYDAYEWHGPLPKLYLKLKGIRKKLWVGAVSELNKNLNPYKWKMQDFELDLRDALRSGLHFYEGKRTQKYIDNLSSSSVIYLYKDRIFVQFFGLPRRFKLPMRGLKDFHYQNQSDTWYDYEEYEYKKKTGKSKGKVWLKMQAKNYRERERIWDVLLKGDGRPCKAGLVFEFIDAGDYLHLTYDIFEKQHGHRTWDDNDKTKVCKICVARRAAYKKEQEEKREKAT